MNLIFGAVRQLPSSVGLYELRVVRTSSSSANSLNITLNAKINMPPKGTALPDRSKPKPKSGPTNDNDNDNARNNEADNVPDVRRREQSNHSPSTLEDRRSGLSIWGRREPPSRPSGQRQSHDTAVQKKTRPASHQPGTGPRQSSTSKPASSARESESFTSESLDSSSSQIYFHDPPEAGEPLDEAAYESEKEREGQDYPERDVDDDGKNSME